MRIAFVLDEFRWIFDSLLEIMRRHDHTGYCGNLFFHDISQPYFIELVPKQINLCHAAKAATKAIEIGFNAGHSAAIMLLANPSLTIRAFDTCSLAYTMPCVEFLNSVFDNRLTLVPGESRLTVGADAVHGYDLAHIDADHSFAAVTADLAKCLQKCLDGAVVIMDDFEGDNDVARATLQRTDLIPSETQMVCRVFPGSSHAMFEYRPSLRSPE
jgi:hypothetical protein